MSSTEQQLLEQLENQQKTIDKLTHQNEELLKQVQLLTEYLALANKKQFGATSEQTNKILPNQLSIFNEVEQESDTKDEEPIYIDSVTNKPKARTKRTREDKIKNLPVIEKIFELSETQRICPHCSGKLKHITNSFVRDELEYVPAKVYVKRILQEVCECPTCKKKGSSRIFKANYPDSLMNHSLATASSVAEVINSKYVNGVPLYRQEKEWSNIGIDLTRTTMANWVINCSEIYLSRIAKRLRTHLLRRDLIHIDETPVQVLKENGKKAENKSYMWLYCSGNDNEAPIVLYDYKPGRSGEYAQKYLETYKGAIHTDGYSGYNRLSNTRCGCWAHVRRKFVEALPNKKDIGSIKTEAQIGIEYIDKLFRIEETIKQLSNEQKVIERAKQAKPVLEVFWNWVESVYPLPGSGLGKAINYAINQKEYLNNYLLDGRYSISNNIAENKIRPFVVGRKNWLFSDTPKGADASAVIYSLVETAKANGLNVRKYIEYLLTWMPYTAAFDTPKSLDVFMPWNEEVREHCT